LRGAGKEIILQYLLNEWKSDNALRQKRHRTSSRNFRPKHTPLNGAHSPKSRISHGSGHLRTSRLSSLPRSISCGGRPNWLDCMAEIFRGIVGSVNSMAINEVLKDTKKPLTPTYWGLHRNNGKSDVNDDLWSQFCFQMDIAITGSVYFVLESWKIGNESGSPEYGQKRAMNQTKSLSIISDLNVLDQLDKVEILIARPRNRAACPDWWFSHQWEGVLVNSFVSKEIHIF
jgi:hypothetical protein